MKYTIILTLLAALFTAGCSTSPVTGKPDAVKAGDIVRPTVATGAGYAIGDLVTDDETGSAIGALAGLVSGLVWNEVSESQGNKQYAEGYAQGQRDTETKVLNDMWTNQTENGSTEQNAVYPNGQYEGVDRTPQGSMEFPTHTNIIR